MDINVTLVGQMVAFGLFVWFTMKYVWPPITSAMQERQQKIADGLAAADKGQRDLKEAAKRSEDELKQAREEARDIVSGANRQANQLIEEARTQAQSEGQRIREQAQAEVEREIRRARDELQRQLGQLAAAGAAQILRREIDAQSHSDIIERLAAEI